MTDVHSTPSASSAAATAPALPYAPQERVTVVLILLFILSLLFLPFCCTIVPKKKKTCNREIFFFSFVNQFLSLPLHVLCNIFLWIVAKLFLCFLYVPNHAGVV